MANLRPAELGEETAKEYVTVAETLPLPKSRQALVQAFTAILEKGGTQRVVVQLGKPIEIVRLVPKDDVPPGQEMTQDGFYVSEPQEMVEEEIWNRMRNGAVYEQPTVQGHPCASLFLAFRKMEELKAEPSMLIVHSYDTLRSWMKDVVGDSPLDRFFGLEVMESIHAPEDAVSLVGETSTGEIAAIRISVDVAAA